MMYRKRYHGAGHSFVFSPAVCTLLALLLSACSEIQSKAGDAAADAVAEQSPAFVYVCADGTRFVSKLEGSRLWLFLPDRTLALKLQQSSAGPIYSNAGVTLASTGEKRARLTVNGRLKRDCLLDRRQSVWESAKLNGVDFRAVGNEPGWYLEIRNSRCIKLVSNYGADTYRFAAPQPVVDQQTGTAFYRMQSNGHELTVTLRARPCRDSMSGESFETVVELRLDGKVLQGCGRALH